LVKKNRWESIWVAAALSARWASMEVVVVTEIKMMFGEEKGEEGQRSCGGWGTQYDFDYLCVASEDHVEWRHLD